jgi:hypothetical protein
MFKDIVVRRYLISIKGRFNKYVIAIGERNDLDKYIASKFGVDSISSSEDLDGSPIILPSLTDESTESNMLNKIFYV